MAITRYSDQEKLAICADWALLGDDKLVADKHGVKLTTLKAWRRAPWFKEHLRNMQSHHSQKLIARANSAMGYALDELEDRITRGDMRCVLKGESVVSYREPVKARDLSQIINVLATRSEKAMSLASQQVQSYQLQDLQTSFRQFAKSYRATDTIDAVDGEIITNGNGLRAEHKTTAGGFGADGPTSEAPNDNGLRAIPDDTIGINGLNSSTTEQDTEPRAGIDEIEEQHNIHSDHLKSLS